MIYCMGKNTKNRLLWDFCDASGRPVNGNSNEYLQQAVFLKQIITDSWLQVSCGKFYDDEDFLITTPDRDNVFNQQFKLEFCGP